MSRDELTTKRWRRPRLLVLVILTALLAIQPTGLLALAQEPTVTMFTVVGVAAATLRAEPNGSSMAVAIVPSGSVVSAAGPDAVTVGITWRHVRTAEGSVGYLPAGFLAWNGVGAPPNEPLASSNVGASEAPVQSVGAAPSGSVGAGPAPLTSDGSSGVAQTGGVVEPSVAGVAAVSSSTARQPEPTATPPTPTPVIPTARTTVERRRGKDVTVTHIAEQTAPNGRAMGAGRIVVKFKPGATEQGQAAAHRAAGSVSSRRAGRADVQIAQVDPGAVQQALAAYRSRSDVAFAEPDYVRRATLTPNDPNLPQQWGPLKIGAPIAWDVTTGAETTRVAILDSGVFTESSTYKAPDGLSGHPDLRGKVILSLERNFSDAVDADDWYGHGTLMAGITGARTNTAAPEGIAGIGFNVQLLNGKVLDDTGSGFDSWVAEGMVWATDMGARIISLSLSGPGPCSQTLQEAVNYAWARNVVIVAAAGNGGADVIGDLGVEAPANCTNVIPVGAIDQNDQRPTFSNFGPGVLLTAPGVDILSTDNLGGYSLVRGTSPATPHVGAVASLLVSTQHGNTNQSIVTRLLQTADPIVGTGSIWGNGRVNAAAAIGPVSCSPRPAVTVANAPTGTALNVTAGVTGVGNAVRFIRSGAVAGPSLNALVIFPTPVSEAGGTKTYVPQTVGATAVFQVKRETPGVGSTLPFIVTDGCGNWTSFAGGGPSAGF
jgi:thermitase